MTVGDAARRARATPRVCVRTGTVEMSFHGFSRQSVDMTPRQARILAGRLEEAVRLLQVAEVLES